MGAKKKKAGKPTDSTTSQESWTSSIQDSAGEDEDIIGVIVNVKFKRGDTFQEMRQLSGGQKAVVSLALIFSFQKCNQSPVCILDEVDAALDSARRKSLSDYIRQRNDIQFVSTTFRKEIIDSGDHFLGVKHENAISKIQPVSKEDALHFVR